MPLVDFCRQRDAPSDADGLLNTRHGQNVTASSIKSKREEKFEQSLAVNECNSL
jgi:hypothetical protein